MVVKLLWVGGGRGLSGVNGGVDVDCIVVNLWDVLLGVVIGCWMVLFGVMFYVIVLFVLKLFGIDWFCF